MDESLLNHFPGWEFWQEGNRSRGGAYLFLAIAFLLMALIGPFLIDDPGSSYSLNWSLLDTSPSRGALVVFLGLGLFAITTFSCKLELNHIASPVRQDKQSRQAWTAMMECYLRGEDIVSQMKSTALPRRDPFSQYLLGRYFQEKDMMQEARQAYRFCRNLDNQRLFESEIKTQLGEMDKHA